MMSVSLWSSLTLGGSKVGMSKENHPPSWSIFNNWQQPEVILPEWATLDSWFNYGQEALLKDKTELINLLNKSDNFLSNYSGDPASHDWHNFRPFKINREEDWSDWLATLIEKSSGYFNKTLFHTLKFSIEDYFNPKVEREDMTEDRYRADIVILWRNKHATHLEVKVGDPHLEKTFDTSYALRKKYHNIPSKNWSDYVLILEEQKYDWDQVVYSKQQYFSDLDIICVSWSDVSIFLRNCLYASSTSNSLETVFWQSWAYAFIGIIEQRLLNFITKNQLFTSKVNINFLSKLNKQIKLMEETLNGR